jgi:DNA (cytosine-5)-methyltransferase 1
MGYHRAGFEVVGVDIKPQKHYPFEFHCADAFAFLEQHGHEFDVIHASPPCQAYSTLRNLGKQNHRPHVDLIAATRLSLRSMWKPFVIENVPGSPLHGSLVLCGQYFGLKVRRHRHFETNMLMLIDSCHSSHRKAPIAVYGDHPERHTYKPGSGGYIHRAATFEIAQDAMGIDWMDWKEITQATPPEYTRWIGMQLLNALENDDAKNRETVGK